jgi:hypothetical protein
MNDFLSRTYQIASAYHRVLGRDPDPDGLRSYLQRIDSVQRIEEDLKKSAEARAVDAALNQAEERIRDLARGRPAILAFGAYGNGNLGDSVQPQLIRTAIQSERDVEVFAYSHLDVAHYAYPTEYALTKGDMPLHPRALALFDALIIGGGGLFAHPHDPLWNPIWADVIPISACILGCGVSTPLPKACRRLFSRATFVSVRDQSSLRAIQEVAPDARLCPDPYLGYARLRRDCRFSRNYRTAYILRGPVTPVHLHLSKTVTSDDIVISMEPMIDFPLREVFPRMTFVNSMEELTDILCCSAHVLTQRYHGAIAAVKLGKPVAGLTTGDQNESKLMELFRQLGLPDWCRQSPDFPPWSAHAYPDREAFLTHSEGDFSAALSDMLACLECPPSTGSRLLSKPLN